MLEISPACAIISAIAYFIALSSSGITARMQSEKSEREGAVMAMEARVVCLCVCV